MKEFCEEGRNLTKLTESKEDFVRWFDHVTRCDQCWDFVSTFFRLSTKKRTTEEVREQVIKDHGEVLKKLSTGSKKIRINKDEKGGED